MADSSDDDSRRARRAEYMRGWNKRNPGYNAANVQQWRARYPGRRKPESRTTDGKSTYKELREVVLRALADRDGGWKCRWCKEEFPMSKLHPDHIIAVREGGEHTLDNLCLACRPCNNRRGIETRRKLHGY